MDDDKQRFCKYLGQQLVSRRTAADLTQAEVARLAGILGNTYARLERGEMVPSAYTLWRIASALDASMEQLVP